jgi:hypothetical protein
MYARASRSIFRLHATRGASAALFTLALVFCRWVHAADREAVRETTALLNARDFCEQTSTRELEPWNFHKKVLSFSLFAPSNEGEEADFPWFLNGVVQNAKDAALYYPDWIVRVYVIGLDIKAERTLQQQENLELVRCPSSLPLNSSSSRKMLTRFLVYDDPKVRLAIVRDADSRLSPRELFAVNEWISSGLEFHTMRDHVAHDVAILGGMFGMKRGALRDASMSELITKALIDSPARITGARGEDQAFLKKYVWPKVKNSCFAHDVNAERCSKFESKTCRNFPMGSRDESTKFYVGASFKSDSLSVSSTQSYVCAVRCAIDAPLTSV